MADEDNNIVDYDDDMEAQEAAPVEKKTKKTKKGSGINASSFKDFMLKPELLRAVIDCGFEHPTEVQHECVPQALLGMDVICQAKSGNGKTGVFVLATLHQMAPVEGEIQVVVLCHVRELAFQIMREYERFAKYLPECKPRVFFGGTNIKGDIDAIEKEKPNIVVGTPGRIMDLIQRGKLDLSKTKHFILDECDRMLAEVGMRKDVQTIFRACPRPCEMEGGSLADLAGMMGLSSVNITDSVNKERERRSSNLSDSSDASVVSVSLSLDGGEVQVTLDTNAFGEA